MLRPISLSHKSPRDKHAIYGRNKRIADKNRKDSKQGPFGLGVTLWKFIPTRGRYDRIQIISFLMSAYNYKKQGGELSERKGWNLSERYSALILMGV